MPLHEAAQSVAWFAILTFAFIGVVLWIDYIKEKKNVRKK